LVFHRQQDKLNNLSKPNLPTYHVKISAIEFAIHTRRLLLGDTSLSAFFFSCVAFYLVVNNSQVSREGVSSAKDFFLRGAVRTIDPLLLVVVDCAFMPCEVVRSRKFKAAYLIRVLIFQSADEGTILRALSICCRAAALATMWLTMCFLFMFLKIGWSVEPSWATTVCTTVGAILFLRLSITTLRRHIRPTFRERRLCQGFHGGKTGSSQTRRALPISVPVSGFSDKRIPLRNTNRARHSSRWHVGISWAAAADGYGVEVEIIRREDHVILRVLILPIVHDRHLWRDSMWRNCGRRRHGLWLKHGLDSTVMLDCCCR
jgi:hypothetical protein